MSSNEDTLNLSVNWTDKDWDKFIKWATYVLHSNEVNVTFTKKDGTERDMRCTLKPELLPKVEITEGKKARKKSETSIAVYDLEVQGWRSFNWRSVKRFAFTL